MERFAGLNFCGFLEYQENFSINVYLDNYTSFVEWHHFSILNVGHCESFPMKNLLDGICERLPPTNPSTFMVCPYLMRDPHTKCII